MPRSPQIHAIVLAVLSFTSMSLSAERTTKSGSVDAGEGVRIHYLESGSGGSQPSVLLVPGWTMPSWIWDGQIEAARFNSLVEEFLRNAAATRSGGRKTP